MKSDRAIALVPYIDDDAMNLHLMQRIFAKSPTIEIEIESDGRRGLDFIRERMPDVVLLDLNLKTMSGESILRDVREHAATAEIPVVVVPGDVSDVTKQRLLVAGAQHFLEKPFSISDVVSLVTGLID